MPWKALNNVDSIHDIPIESCLIYCQISTIGNRTRKFLSEVETRQSSNARCNSSDGNVAIHFKWTSES